MSDEFPPYDDEPTKAHRPFDDEIDATRVERPIPPYDATRGNTEYDRPAFSNESAWQEEKRGGIIAPLVTVGLVCILLGMGVGYLLFHNSTGSAPAATTTTIAAQTTTTTEAPTSSSERTTSTTKRTTTSTTSTTAPTTSTIKKSTTTSSSSSTSVP